MSVFAYFSMVSGMGWETIMGCRQFFYVRCVLCDILPCTVRAAFDNSVYATRMHSAFAVLV